MSDVTTPQPFLDWYGIFAGSTSMDAGEVWYQDVPVGVRLAVQPALKSDIFIHPEKPWEEGGLTPQVALYADGMIKLWYITRGDGDGQPSYIACAESDDGFAWRRPEFNLTEFEGSTANNLLFDFKEFELQSVFVDPSAPPESRYKAMARSAITYLNGEVVTVTRDRKWEIRRELEEAGLTPEQRAEAFYGEGLLLGATSPDGVHWTFLEEPLLNVGRSGLDSQNIAAYDSDTGTYVGDLRGHQDRRRLVRRTEGKAFANWSPTRPVFALDPQDPVSDDIYASAYCRCPSSGRHLMFPAIYHRATGRIDLQLATSRDGLVWSRPERVPILSRQPEGYGMIFSFPEIVQLDTETWGLMFIGQFDLHDWNDRHDPGRKPEWRWATWKRDRLVALEAEVEGRATVVERECAGNELQINYQTQKEGGWIKVELVEPPTSPATPVQAFPGFSLEEADPLAGDELARTVTWRNGKSDLSSLRGRKVAVRLHMNRAKVFSTAL
jgi:hypothetical protein